MSTLLLSFLTSDAMIILTLMLSAVSLIVLPNPEPNGSVLNDAWQILTNKVQSLVKRVPSEGADLHTADVDDILPHPYPEGRPCRLPRPSKKCTDSIFWPLSTTPRSLHRVFKNAI